MPARRRVDDGTRSPHAIIATRRRPMNRSTTRLLLAALAALALPLAAAAEEPAKPSPRAKDERGMRIYYMGFLTRGAAWTPEVTEATKKLQAEHMANIERLAQDGRLLIAGPFAYDAADADQSLRGIFIFDTETRAEAEALAATDPAVKAGRLAISIIPWYGPYGLTYEDHAKHVKKQ
jgi:uncharacterized protein YciI